MSGLRAFFLLCSCLAAVPSCKKEDDDSPPPPALGGAGNHYPLPPLVGGASGDGDGDITGDGDGDATTNLLVALASYDNHRLTSTTRYSESTVVSQLESGAGDLGSAVIEDGAGDLTLTDVNGTFWLSAYPEDDTSMIPTLVPNGLAVDGVMIGVDQVVLMPKEVLSDILATTSSDQVPGGAQLLLRFVDQSFQPLSGVRVEYVEGGLLRTFASGSTWDENLTISDDRGLCLYYSIPASSFPGQLHDVHLRGAIDGDYRVQLVDGAITVATFMQE